jgi:hypothetical protein
MSALADPVAAYPVKTRSPNVRIRSFCSGGFDFGIVFQHSASEQPAGNRPQVRDACFAKHPN